MSRTIAQGSPGTAFVRGFTLVEVLVVVVILGVLAAVIVPKVMGRPDEARAVRATQDVAAIVSALNMYRLDNYSYPSSEQGLRALVEKPPGADNWRDGSYLANVPKDPWNRQYLYQNPGQHGEVDVWTYGADGKPGGERSNADIGNWQP